MNHVHGQRCPSHYTKYLIESFIDGLNSRRPGLWNIYAPCPPEHAIADNASEMQNKLAVESRAYPLMVFDPDAGSTWEECLSLEGNPPWMRISHNLQVLNSG